MRIVLVTQDESFYLYDALSYLLKELPEQHRLISVVLLSESPYGRKEAFFRKALKTVRIFGLKFFLYYAFKFVVNRFIKRKTLRKLLFAEGIPELVLSESINAQSSLAKLNSLSPDLLISISANEIFKKPLLDIAPCLNLHTSPLPAYRGLMPSFWVLKNGEEETAVTVFKVDEGIDTGPIVVQRFFKIEGSTHAELIVRSKLIGMEAVIEAIESVANKSPPVPPRDSVADSYFGFPTRRDVEQFYSEGARFF